MNADAALTAAHKLRSAAEEFISLAATRTPEGPDAYAVASAYGAGTAINAGPCSTVDVSVKPDLAEVSVLTKDIAERIAERYGDEFEVVKYDDLARLNAEHMMATADMLEQQSRKRRAPAREYDPSQLHTLGWLQFKERGEENMYFTLQDGSRGFIKIL
jgi:hypothetical protein